MSDSTTPADPADETPAEAAPPDSVGWRTAGCGLCMGAADIVPGVSGGTVALVLGVYERLLAAISGFDRRFLAELFGGDLRAAARRVDAVFLAALGGGIGVGVVGLAGLMHHLLEHHQAATFAAFFGLILGSGVLVGRMARPRGPAATAVCAALGVAAAGLALGVVTLQRVTAPEGLGYTFVCGAVAICAMILPGVSGAYLLLLLGKYEEVTGILKRLPKLDVSGADVATVAVFCVGCLLGLLLFSRLLRWLLRTRHDPTMATLCGFMIGSLYRVWPFQRDTTPEVEEFKRKVFEPVWPSAWSGEAGLCLALAVGAFALVLTVDALARRREGVSREV